MGKKIYASKDALDHQHHNKKFAGVESKINTGNRLDTTSETNS